MRLSWALLVLSLSGCTLAVRDVRVQVAPDLKASVSALASQSGDSPGTDRAFLDDWRRRIEGCGGTTRVLLSGVPQIEARFEVTNDRERRIITNCLDSTDVDFHYDLSVSRGWIYDTYSLRVRLVHKFLGPALIPGHFEVQMPGTVIDHIDNSAWPTHSIAWTSNGGLATAEVRSLGDEALRRETERVERLPPSGRAGALDRVWEFEVRSRERKMSAIEMIGVASMIAAIVPLGGLVSRPFRRRRKARAAARSVPETEGGKA